MKKIKSYINDYFSTLYGIDKYKLFKIFFLNILFILLEGLTISLLVPILYLFIKDDYSYFLNNFNLLTKYNINFKLLDFNSLIFIFLIFFLVIYILKTIFFIYYQKSKFYFLAYYNNHIVRKLYKKYLEQDYFFFIQNSSSKIIRNFTGDCNILSYSITPSVIHLLNESLKIIVIILILFLFSPKATFSIIILLSIFLFFFYRIYSSKIKLLGSNKHLYSAKVIQKLQESIKSIKETIIYDLRHLFFKDFITPVERLSFYKKDSEIINYIIRPTLEVYCLIVFILLVIFALRLNYQKDTVFVIVGLFTFSLSRILPSILLIVRSVNDIKENYLSIKVISSVFKLSKKIKRLQNKEKFINSLELNNVSYKFPGDKHFTLKNINLKIKKGDKLGIYGKSGVGKTTLINIIAGLYEINHGYLKINKTIFDKKFSYCNKQISYVPQSVVIFEDTILFNITLERKKEPLVISRVLKILKTVELFDFVLSLKNGIYNYLGENGVNLSGGQLQRLAIARAIYREPSILILDESTSSIDRINESLILNKIYQCFSNKIIIHISHKKSILKFCSKLIEVKNKKILSAR